MDLLALDFPNKLYNLIYFKIVFFLLWYLILFICLLDTAVVQNDLTKENVDVIVNAANSWLKHGGGVS